MRYILPGEVAILAPEVADSALLETETQRRHFIIRGTADLDAACGRAGVGLELRDIYNEDVRLDQDLAGKLAYAPHRGWIGAEAELYYFGDQTVIETLSYADFSITGKTGAIRNLNGHPLSASSSGFDRPRAGYSPYSQVMLPYHARSSSHVSNNLRPFVMKASYRTGFFTIKSIVLASATADLTQIELEDVVGLRAGQEFYFDADIDQADTDEFVEKRFITEVNETTRIVEFTPKVSYPLPTTAKFRQIDFAVRAALAEMIADRVTLPANISRFSKGLGQGDLVKSWTRLNNVDVPMGAARKLTPYMR